ncbi:ribonuclease Y [candidate division Kazan bacterium RBG_13_50_9]|uniref:Ribonuclease Y n=1 Tax=candidate division Kazan bacterium RBG_13_50_9 TaxID=1798535 RepID=A0A1F4NRR6_UNCK3|nr:MAG: ribonuclease Y [candidate division Kazan bacterium RBG_13_50_9]
MESWLIWLVWLLAGAALGYLIRAALSQRRVSRAEQEADKIIKKAQDRLDEAAQKEKEIVIAAKEEASKIRERAEGEEQRRRTELADWEKRLGQKDETLDRRTEDLDRKQENVLKQDEGIKEVREEILKIREQQEEKLAAIAKLSKEEAKELLLKRTEKEAKDDILKLMRDIEEQARDEAEAKARDIISSAIQRYASETAVESTTNVVQLPSDDLKGRVIGKEGRNIQAFERATGVDLIVDDTPEVVVISGFDPVRRAIAKKALERLVADGRIQPARIEEMVERAKKEIASDIKKAGEEAVLELGLTGLPLDLIKIIGRLKYRTSYGQNILKHSVEAAHLAGMMAAQVGADVRLAKLATLIHDIGKALDHEMEGTHIDLSKDIAVKYGMPKEVIQAIEVSHEGSGGPKTAIDFISMAADAISASRPGARRESLEQYIKRLGDLENIATSFEGVERAYAIQAGREVRVLVIPEEIDDLGIIKLAKDIAQKIEKDMTYPGTVKVNVIRETRAEDVAK